MSLKEKEIDWIKVDYSKKQDPPINRVPYSKTGKTTIPTDSVSHPSHYTDGSIECIDAIRASMPPEEFGGFCKGNVIKYLWRFEKKGGFEDLEKAEVYLTWLINIMKGEDLTKI